jgi:hypothetical protein
MIKTIVALKNTMSSYNVDNSNLHVLLIGIDYYFPNPLYSNLGGCVRDVSHVEDLLLHKVRGIRSGNILKLTSSIGNSDSSGPIESEDRWPTYVNIVNAFNKITAAAKPGDQVYFHYAGHGGRVRTLLTNTKGSNGFDETLVPTDIGNAQTRHLRDIEIALLIRRMMDKNLTVTLIFDSCHSGGITRGRGGAVVRGSDIEDRTPRPLDSLVGTTGELERIWQDMSGTGTKTVPLIPISAATRGISASGWLPKPKGYVLLAACRPSESAYEYAFEGGESNGALTYWFLKSCEQMDRSLSYKVIHDRIVSKVHSQFPEQTPMLEGEGDREVFGVNRVQPVYAVSVMKVETTNRRLLLNAGQSHGIRRGTRFAVYPLGSTDFADVVKRLCLVEIDERGAINSWAKITEDFERGEIEQGAQAVLINSVDIRLKRKVRLVYENSVSTNEKGLSSVSDISKQKQKQALDRLGNILAMKNANNETNLELAKEEFDHADFQVAVNTQNAYEIWDPAGKVVPNLNTPLSISEENAFKLIERLEHLVKYSNIQLIDNLDADSEISRKLEVELAKAPDDYELGDRPSNLQPLDSEGNAKVAEVGKKLIMRIRNGYPEKEKSKVLNVAILDLQPDWGISQIIPTSPGANFVPIDPGHEEIFSFNVDLPSHYTEGKDILKVFATLDETSFRWLELPPLDLPPTQRGVSNVQSRSSKNISQPINPLEQLMASITRDRPVTRNVNPSATPSKEWTSRQIEVSIHR